MKDYSANSTEQDLSDAGKKEHPICVWRICSTDLNLKKALFNRHSGFVGGNMMSFLRMSKLKPRL